MQDGLNETKQDDMVETLNKLTNGNSSSMSLTHTHTINSWLFSSVHLYPMCNANTTLSSVHCSTFLVHCFFVLYRWWTDGLLYYCSLLCYCVSCWGVYSFPFGCLFSCFTAGHLSSRIYCTCLFVASFFAWVKTRRDILNKKKQLF